MFGGWLILPLAARTCLRHLSIQVPHILMAGARVSHDVCRPSWNLTVLFPLPPSLVHASSAAVFLDSSPHYSTPWEMDPRTRLPLPLWLGFAGLHLMTTSRSLPPSDHPNQNPPYSYRPPRGPNLTNSAVYCRFPRMACCALHVPLANKAR